MQTNNNVKNNLSQDQKETAMAVMTRIEEILSMFIPGILAKKLVSFIMSVLGFPDSVVSEVTGYSERSCRRMRREMDEVSKTDGDISSMIFMKKGRGRKSKTENLGEAITTEIESANYYDRQQIAHMLDIKFGIKLCVTAVGNLLRKLNIRKRKSGSLPAKADPERQKQFYEATLKPLMKQAKEGKILLYFADASHFVLGCDFLGRIYGRARRLARTFSGRKRYNVLGALDFISKKVLTVVNDTTITKIEVGELLKKIAAQNPLGLPIHVVLDNAASHHSHYVRDLAKELNIIIDYIPPYSPNLNLIERLWRFVKGELRKQFFDEFEVFKKAIDYILESTTKDNKEKIDSLIGEKVQLYHDLVEVTGNTYSKAA